jgi:hypothetical protein
MRNIRKALSMSAEIGPGKHTVVTAEPRETFRPERVLISPNSFPLPRWRLAWTWLPFTIGNGLGRAHRSIAKLLRVDLHAEHERREYLPDNYEGGETDEIFYDYGEDDGRYYRLVAIPLNRRERFLAPIGRVADRLSRVRTSWQLRHLAMVSIRNVTISKHPLMAPGSVLPADMFTHAVDAFVSFEPCKEGSKIEIEIANGSPRACQLVMSLIGTAVEAESYSSAKISS